MFFWLDCLHKRGAALAGGVTTWVILLTRSKRPCERMTTRLLSHQAPSPVSLPLVFAVYDSFPLFFFLFDLRFFFFGHLSLYGRNPVFYQCKENPHSSSLPFLSCVCPLLVTQNTSFLKLLVTKRVEVFSPHPAILCDTHWVSCNLTQF